MQICTLVHNGEFGMGFFFVRRSRYEALRKDLQSWQRMEAEATEKLRLAEERAVNARTLYEGNKEWVSKLTAEVARLNERQEEIASLADKILVATASPVSESVLEDAV